MLKSETLAIAAHLHVLLRRKTGRVTDTEWMAADLAYATEVIRHQLPGWAVVNVMVTDTQRSASEEIVEILDRLDERIRSIAGAEKRAADNAATMEALERQPQVRENEPQVDEFRKFATGETRSFVVEARDLTKGSATAAAASAAAVGDVVAPAAAGVERAVELAAFLGECLRAGLSPTAGTVAIFGGTILVGMTEI